MDCDVVVAGTGIAACACALRFLALRFRPLLISCGREIQAGAEAIAEPAWELFGALGLEGALRAAGAEIVDGFENAWNESEVHWKRGRWIHVDRRALAAAALKEAVGRGALVHVCDQLPRLRPRHGGVRVRFEDGEREFLAAVDATGRSAVWSRPIHRLGREVAGIFHLQGPCPGSGKIVRVSDDRWAYFIGSRTLPTVGIIGRSTRTLDDSVRKHLNISMDARFVGPRPAFPQWCDRPIEQRRLAVGDAALAYNPLAGQGIRFALASAYSAAAVLRTWRDDPAAAAAAERYYADFVDSARRRHFEFLDSLHAGQERKGAKPISIPETVRFTGRTRIAAVNRDSRIVQEEVLETADGGALRWVGGFDLLCLRDMAQIPVRTAHLVEQLQRLPMTAAHARMLVRWCLERQVLT